MRGSGSLEFVSDSEDSVIDVEANVYQAYATQRLGRWNIDRETNSGSDWVHFLQRRYITIALKVAMVNYRYSISGSGMKVVSVVYLILKLRPI